MLERLLALLLLILLAPVFLLIILLIATSNNFPIIFLQKRVGRNGDKFNCYKFRTMHLNAQREKIRWKKNHPELWQEYQENNFKLKSDHRITKIGKILRKTNLDELPQLLNIIRGEMSFIGPRPILLREIKIYGPAIKFYKKLKPGITGLWQVSGKNNTSFKKRIELDKYYLENKSLKLDLYILAKTILIILRLRNY